MTQMDVDLFFVASHQGQNPGNVRGGREVVGPKLLCDDLGGSESLSRLPDNCRSKLPCGTVTDGPTALAVLRFGRVPDLPGNIRQIRQTRFFTRPVSRQTNPGKELQGIGTGPCLDPCQELDQGFSGKQVSGVFDDCASASEIR